MSKKEKAAPQNGTTPITHTDVTTAPTSAPFAGCVESSPANVKCRSGVKSGMPCMTAT